MATQDYISADKLSTWSMATGIAGLIVMPGFAHLVAVVTGALALQKASRLYTQQTVSIKAKARLGLLFGIFGLVCITIGIFLFFFVFSASLGAVALLLGATG